MTKVLVHGNPETSAIWGPLIEALNARGCRDIVTVSPPGFGAPVPQGFNAHPDEYVAWLADQIDGINGPVDLLGHDWGTGHVVGLAAVHPELIRSWAIDIGGLLHPEYVWHDMAQLWRTDGVGEETVAAMVGMSDQDKLDTFTGLGMTAEIATSIVPWLNDDMGRCILNLYRAADPEWMASLADSLEAAARRPSLSLSAENDAYVAAALNGPVAERMGSLLVELPGQGHWWMIENPNPAADALVEFWESLSRRAGSLGLKTGSEPLK